MKQGLALLLAEFRIGIVEDKPDGGKEIALARAIPAHNHIHPRAEGADDHLVPVGLEAVDRQLGKGVSERGIMQRGVPA